MAGFMVGDPIPWFTARSFSRPDFHLSQCAGRYVVLSFVASSTAPGLTPMLDMMLARPDRLNDDFACLMLVTSDPEDERGRRIQDRRGLHVMWDSDATIAASYGLIQRRPDGGVALARRTFILDPLLRVLAVVPITDPADHAAQVMAFLDTLPPHPPGGRGSQAPPVLMLPRVFEPELCRALIGMYQRHNEDSGFMREDPTTGKTIGVSDHGFKRRRDHMIEDEAIQRELRARIWRRLVPEIEKAFAFRATQIERYLVACYDAADGGHFRGHRDNTTKGTAHRRFAVTINLNAEEYDGGDLIFPEFDRRSYRAPTGGAVVFSCSLMHEAQTVTRGTRYCFLPFLYDDESARLRAGNLKFLERPPAPE